MLGSFCILLNLLLIMLNHKTTLFISKISKKKHYQKQSGENTKTSFFL